MIEYKHCCKNSTYRVLGLFGIWDSVHRSLYNLWIQRSLGVVAEEHALQSMTKCSVHTWRKMFLKFIKQQFQCTCVLYIYNVKIYLNWVHPSLLKSAKNENCDERKYVLSSLHSRRSLNDYWLHENTVWHERPNRLWWSPHRANVTCMYCVYYIILYAIVL